jgi:dethiobiotin synthetase
MKSVFVTATDTGVGKTVVTAGLVAAARARGIDAVPMKPTQTGCIRVHRRWIAPDLAFCHDMAGYGPPDAEMALACPFPFEPACSPHLAAALTGSRVSIDRIRYRFNRLRSQHDAVVVEGAGGVLVPINERDSMIDLMVALKTPILLVTRTTLGTLNHTLLTIDVIRRRGLKILGMVAVHHDARPIGMIEQNNLETLRGIARIPILAQLPFCEALARNTVTPEEFHRAILPAIQPVLDAII